jgi:mannose-1-phosphate guanylyltransferase
VIDTALVLAAGLGTRLAPLSALRAKAALPVAGEALVRRQIRWLAAAGVTRVVVNLHHRPATITALLGHGDDLGVAVSYSWEPVVLGSAGGPRRALELLARDRFFIVNGDTLTDLDLSALAAVHAGSGALVTMAASPDLPAGYNALLVDDAGRWCGVRRAGTTDEARSGQSAVHFVGIQVADAAAFAGLPADAASESLRQAYPPLLHDDAGAVRVWTTGATFRDVQTPADYLETARAVAAAERRPIDRGRQAAVAPSARLDGSILWDDVVVGEDVELVDCVVGDRAHVPDGLRARAASIVPISTGHAAGPRDLAVGEVVVVPFARPAAAAG